MYKLNGSATVAYNIPLQYYMSFAYHCQKHDQGRKLSTNMRHVFVRKKGKNDWVTPNDIEGADKIILMYILKSQVADI